MNSKNTKLACLNSVKRTKDGKRPPTPPTPVEKKIVDVTKLVDRSGSVASMSHTGYGGMPQFIKDQKKTSKDENVEIRITFTTFDGAATTWYEDKDVTTFPDLITDDDVRHQVYPRGATLLVDTLMDAAVASSRRYNALVDKYGENNVSSIFFVWTDGDDNQSHRWTTPDVNRVLAKIQENPKRTVLWTAANQDAMKSGAKFGIAAANCMTTQATPLGAAPMYRACSAAVSRGCSGGNAAFTPQERTANSRAATMPAAGTPARPGYGQHPGVPRGMRWVPGSFAGGGLRHNNNTVMASGRCPPPPPPRFGGGGGGGGGGRGGSWGGPAGGRGHAGPTSPTLPPSAYFRNAWSNVPLPGPAAAAAPLPPAPQAMVGMGAIPPPPAAVAPPPSSGTAPPN